VRFLLDAAAALGGEAGQALERAAAFYRQESELLCTVFPGKDAFLGPWSGRSESDWTDEVSAKEREILTEAKKIEVSAISEIEKALAALGQ
jgi:hypothetical protein